MFETEKNQKKYKFSFFTSKYKGKLKNRPIPSLSDTKKSFVKFIKPFLDNKSDTEFHEELINDFIKDEGNSLQKKLVELSNVIPSWHYDLMLENLHLQNKKPIPFFSNYFIVFDLNFKDQIDAFAKIILSSIFLKRMIKDEKISELTMKDYTQYFCLFHSCRIPNYEINRNFETQDNSERNRNLDFDVKIDFEDKDKINKNKNKNGKNLINKERKSSASADENETAIENKSDGIHVLQDSSVDDKNLKNNIKTEAKENDNKSSIKIEANFNEIDAVNKKYLQIKAEAKASPKTFSDPLSRENLPQNKNTQQNKIELNEIKNENQILKTKNSKKNFSTTIKENLNIFDYDDNKFVVVLYKNIFWLVETSLDYEHLSEQLLYITSLDLSEKQENFIGVLTGSDRNQWAKARHKFLKISPKNQNFIFFVERSMMVFCLCDSIYDRLEYNELFTCLWFNDLNNRFFDKVLQVIIFKDGTVCLNIEKSAVDVSVAVEFLKFVRYLNANEQVMQKTIRKKPVLAAHTGNNVVSNVNLNVNKSAGNKNDIKKKDEKNNKEQLARTKVNLDNNGKRDNVNVQMSSSKSATKKKNAYSNKSSNAKEKKNEKNFLHKAENLSYFNNTNFNEEENENSIFNKKQIFGSSSINYFENFINKPVRLNYDLTEKLKSQINLTAKNFRKEITEKISSEIFTFKDFGKQIFERKGVDMASFIQLAALSAHYRTYGKIVASRLFVCGRNFRFGIEEFVRTTVKESVNFIVSLNELRIPRDLKVKLGQDFFKENKKNVNEVLNGKSIDVHFAGLSFVKRKREKSEFSNTEKIEQQIYEFNSANTNNTRRSNSNNKNNNAYKNKNNNNKESFYREENLNENKDLEDGFNEENENVIKEKSSIKKLLNDEMFKKASDFVIETYPLTNEHVKLCLQGYVNEIDGLSITYIARKDHIQFNLVSANDLRKFIQALEEILYEMKDLFLEKGREYKPKF